MYFQFQKNELQVGSFLAINDLKCLNLSNLNVANFMNTLDENTKISLAKFVDEKQILKKKPFLAELEKNLKKLFTKLKDAIDNIGLDYDFNENLLKLVKYLSKKAVDIDCLQQLPAKRIVDANLLYTDNLWSYYFDFDFIDTEAYLNYKLFNKLSLNPKINLLIGAVSDEECSSKFILKDIFPTDKFNAPKIPKKEAQKIIKASSRLLTGKEEFGDIMAAYYTDETKWQLDDGYAESFSNAVGDQNYYWYGLFSLFLIFLIYL